MVLKCQVLSLRGIYFTWKTLGASGTGLKGVV